MDEPSQSLPLPPDDDLELRPSPENSDADDMAEIPLADVPSELPRSLQKAPPGKFKCDSCDRIRDQAEAHQVEDRQLCFNCFTHRNNTFAREKSRMADAAKSGTLLSVSNSRALVLVFAVPVAGWLLLLASAEYLLGAQSPVDAANNMMLVNLIIVALFFGSMIATSKIFGGYDLPTLPNRIWKMTALITLDMLLFLVAIRLSAYVPCFLLIYFFVGRTLVFVIGLVLLLGLEFVESVITTLIVWFVICIALINPTTRAILIPV